MDIYQAKAKSPPLLDRPSIRSSEAGAGQMRERERLGPRRGGGGGGGGEGGLWLRQAYGERCNWSCSNARVKVEKRGRLAGNETVIAHKA